MKRKNTAMNKAITIAGNPVSRAIERAALKAHVKAMQAEIRSLADGDLCTSLVRGLGETTGRAMKTIEGWDDPDAIGDVLEAAHVAMVSMHDAEADCFRWNAAHAAVMCDAVDCAAQVIAGMPVEANIRAKLWHDSIVMRSLILRELEAAGCST